MKRGVVIFILISIFSLNSYSKYFKGDYCEYETASEIDVEVIVSMDIEEGWYVYKYKIKNLPSSKWEIVFYFLESKDVYRSKDFTMISTYSSPEEYISIDPQNYNLPRVSTGGEQSKDEEKSSIGWLFENHIEIGSERDVVVKTRLLPLIYDYYIEGPAYIRCKYGMAGPEGVLDEYYLKETKYGPGVVGKTLVPGVYPENRYAHLDRLGGEIVVAKRLGWIKNEEVYKDLKKIISDMELIIKRGIEKKESVKDLIGLIRKMNSEGLISNELYHLLRTHFLFLAN